MKKTPLVRFFTSKEALLYVIAVAMVLSFSAWMSLLNNYTVEIAGFTGPQIGMLQSLREVPGLLAFTVLWVLLLVRQQHLVYLSMLLLGIGTAITGLFHGALGLYAATVVMSVGFHYLETLSQALSLQWLDKHRAPVVLGRLQAVRSLVGLLVIVALYVLMEWYGLGYAHVYVLFGMATVLVAVAAWMGFHHFKETVVQEKKIRLKREYWLFYVLTFFAGARRQIFVVFAGFLLVQKFGVRVEEMMLFLFVNAATTIYFAPKIGRFIQRFGERLTLRLEYAGLVIIFASYAFVQDLAVAFVLYVVDNLLFSMAIALRTYFQKIADPRDLSNASAVSSTINHVAAVFLPALLGLLWQSSYSAVFLIGAAIGACSLLLSFLVPRTPARGMETILVKHESAYEVNP